MKTLFNYFELENKSRNDPLALVVLAYSLTKPKAKPVFLNNKNILNTLNIDRTPFDLFRKKYLLYKKNRVYK